MTVTLVAGLLAGYGIALPVGAVATYLVALTARTSLRVGAAAALGVATADGLYGLAAVVGGGALAGLITPIADPLRVTSGLILAFMAVRGALHAVRAHRAGRSQAADIGDQTRAPAAYLTLLGVTILNPTTVVYFTALVLGGSSAAVSSPQGAMVFVLATFAASASWQLVLAAGGAVLGRVLTGRRGRLVTAGTSSLIIAGLAVHLLLP